MKKILIVFALLSFLYSQNLKLNIEPLYYPPLKTNQLKINETVAIIVTTATFVAITLLIIYSNKNINREHP